MVSRTFEASYCGVIESCLMLGRLSLPGGEGSMVFSSRLCVPGAGNEKHPREGVRAGSVSLA